MTAKTAAKGEAPRCPICNKETLAEGICLVCQSLDADTPESRDRQFEREKHAEAIHG